MVSYFSFQTVFHNWCNKDHSMYYPICGRSVINVDYYFLFILKFNKKSELQ